MLMSRQRRDVSMSSQARGAPSAAAYASMGQTPSQSSPQGQGSVSNMIFTTPLLTTWLGRGIQAPTAAQYHSAPPQQVPHQQQQQPQYQPQQPQPGTSSLYFASLNHVCVSGLACHTWFLSGAAVFDPDQFEAARQCIEAGNVPAFRQAISRMNVNMQDVEDEGNTLLHWAVGYNNANMARELLLHGARQLSNEMGMTPYELACQAFHSGDSSYFAIKQLFEQGVTADSR